MRRESSAKNGAKKYRFGTGNVQRFFGTFDLSKSRLVLDNPALVKQIRLVLRMRPGDRCVLLDGKGNEAEASVISVLPKAVTVEILSRKKSSVVPLRNVTLYCALLKRENFEWVVQKATEAGVMRIVPLITSRTVKLHGNAVRLAAIAKEAAEQSGRTTIPVCEAPQSFEDAVAAAEGVHLFCDFTGDNILSRKGTLPGECGVWVGPEGGWNDEERMLARNAKYISVRLGALTLRAETAATVAAFLAVNL